MNGFLKIITSTITKNAFNGSCRLLSGSPALRCAYQGPGKTTAKILNREDETGIMINAFSTSGFRLNNGLSLLGAAAIFPRSVLSWNVKCFEDVNEKSLSLFLILEPKIDILVIGCGHERFVKWQPELVKTLKKHGITVEILSTEQACSTFNFLVSEGRNAAAGLIPPDIVNVTQGDLHNSAKHYNDPFLNNEIEEKR